MKEKKSAREKFLKAILPVLPPGPGESIRVNPVFFNFLLSPISVMFPADKPRSFYGLPAESYLNEISNTIKTFYPPPLIDAINNQNEIVLKINLNHKQQTIVKHFSRLLAIASEELKKNNRKVRKIYDRDFGLYWTVYDLHRNKKWTYLRIAKKIFPKEFEEPDPYSDDESVSEPNPESTVVRIKQIFKEAKKMIGG